MNYAKTLTGEHITPGQMSQFLETFVTQGRKNLEAVTALDEEIVKVERLIEKEKESSLLQKGQSNGQARIVLGVEEKCNVEFKLTYSECIAAYYGYDTNVNSSRLQCILGTDLRAARHDIQWQAFDIRLFTLPCSHYAKHR